MAHVWGPLVTFRRPQLLSYGSDRETVFRFEISDLETPLYDHKIIFFMFKKMTHLYQVKDGYAVNTRVVGNPRYTEIDKPIFTRRI